MYKNLTRFTASDSPAACWSLARVIIIVCFWGRIEETTVTFWNCLTFIIYENNLVGYFNVRRTATAPCAKLSYCTNILLHCYLLLLLLLQSITTKYFGYSSVLLAQVGVVSFTITTTMIEGIYFYFYYYVSRVSKIISWEQYTLFV